MMLQEYHQLPFVGDSVYKKEQYEYKPYVKRYDTHRQSIQFRKYSRFFLGYMVKYSRK